MMTKRASRWDALFAWGRILLGRLAVCLAGFTLGGLPTAVSAAVPAARCQVSHYDATARVRHVHDGDTLTLDDGRRVRIIGLDTPELGRDGRPPQAYAVAARDALRALLRHDARVHLRYGTDRRDHYGRTLAHVYLMDGRDVAAVLLRAGLATALVIPPNLSGVACYQAAESAARTQGRGLWSLAAYQSVPAARLGRHDTGFHLIHGRVLRVKRARHGWWLILPGLLVIHLRDEDMGNFPGFAPRTLVGQEVAARGWLHYHRHWRNAGGGARLSLRVRHPAALFLLQ